MDAKRRSVVVRYEVSEYEAVKAYAAQMGITPSELIRKAVKGYLEANNAPTSVVKVDPNQLRIE
jgi:predicted DNA binding CopG/RHH family protein